MWCRPYHDPWRLFTGLVAGVGSAFFAFLVYRMFTTPNNVSMQVAFLILVFGVGWVTLAWRLHLTALLVGDEGIRLRWTLLTRTVAWSQIRGFRTERDFGAQRLFIELHSGDRVRTPVQRAHSARAMRINDGGTWLRPEQYDALLSDLRTRLAQPHRPAREGRG
jgi:hypothetical protein